MLTPEQQKAVIQIAAAAVECERATGVPAELTASQCIFESGYLKAAPGCNCFGIKVDGHGCGTQYVLTTEYLNGQYQHMPLAFEQYNSLTDCFNDHARLICQGPYAKAWKQYQADHKLDDYIKAICPIYATDPQYTAKMLAEAHSSTVTMAVQAARQNLIAKQDAA